MATINKRKDQDGNMRFQVIIRLTIERLAKDLQNSFPGVGGFSRSNVFKMRALYLSCIKVSQAVRQITELPFFQIPWSHNVILLTKLKKDLHRLWSGHRKLEQFFEIFIL